MANIGNCDTCDYILKCNRASCTGQSLLKSMYGCPKDLQEQYLKDIDKKKGSKNE